MASVLPLGPYHPALSEPVWYHLHLQGETIARVEITTGYAARGVEALLTQRDVEDGLKLAERLCGSAAHHHRLGYCLALERLAAVQPPPRARALRSLFCEVERLLSHLSWAAQVARAVERPRAFYAAIEAHERLVEALEQATGRRLLWGLPIPGGVASAPDLAPLEQELASFSETLDQLEQRLARERGMQRRARGLATITAEQAREATLTGPIARAAGLEYDTRRAAPYDAYASLELSEHAASTAGDTQTRLVTRLDEMRASLDLAESLLEQLPDGPLAQPFPNLLPSGEAEASIEGPQGQETWRIQGNGSARPASVTITTASRRNLAAVPLALEGNHLSDALLILASLDLCIACVDK
ncbi:MAG TPA: nickel-dependent hydrogenase large subunit [Ktedonobacterales bacterium]